MFRFPVHLMWTELRQDKQVVLGLQINELCNVGGEREGYGPLSMAVVPVSLKTWQATCEISAHAFIPLYRPYKARSLWH